MQTCIDQMVHVHLQGRQRELLPGQPNCPNQSTQPTRREAMYWCVRCGPPIASSWCRPRPDRTSASVISPGGGAGGEICGEQGGLELARRQLGRRATALKQATISAGGPLARDDHERNQPIPACPTMRACTCTRLRSAALPNCRPRMEASMRSRASLPYLRASDGAQVGGQW